MKRSSIITFSLLTLLLTTLSGCESALEEIADEIRGEEQVIEQGELQRCFPSRGLSLLALQHPNFPVGEASELLSFSKCPGFSTLWDTFGSEREHIRELIFDANERGDVPWVSIYLDCGPCRPPRRDGSLLLIQPDSTISQINKLILQNDSVRREYKEGLEQILSFIEVSERARFDADWTIFLSLEDNYTEESFRALESILVPLIQRNDVQVGRNPLSPFPVNYHPFEVHSYQKLWLMELSPGDFLSGDGQLFTFPDEANAGFNVGFTHEDIKQLAKASTELEIHLQLWRPEWQGLPLFAPPGTQAPHPDDRTYKFTHKERIREILSE